MAQTTAGTLISTQAAAGPDRAADVLRAENVVGVDVEGALGVRRPGFDRIRRDLRDGLDERGEAVLGRELDVRDGREFHAVDRRARRSQVVGQ